MYSIEDLTKKFNALDDNGKDLVFEQLTRNAATYIKIMPDMPLLRFILEGEVAVPVNQHGPIITAYKAWYANPKNRARLRN